MVLYTGIAQVILNLLDAPPPVTKAEKRERATATASLIMHMFDPDGWAAIEGCIQVSEGEMSDKPEPRYGGPLTGNEKIADKPEPPHGLLAQLEQVRVEIERLAGMATILVSSGDLGQAWDDICGYENQLAIIREEWGHVLDERREASK